ncbi:phosphotransferase [Candidatus Woesearchaeota archaeon]|nr:phosphotransferase [Candidatus Woesearchaeota archaeon]
MDRSHMKIEDESIEKVLSKIGESLESKQLFNNGFNNQVYFIKTKSGKELVLRLTNPLEKWKTYKTLNEVEAINFLSEKTNIPVPQILDYSIDKELVGFEYILMNKIEGEPLSEKYESYSKEDRTHVLQQIADFYVQIKQFEFDKIGWFGKNMVISKVGDIESGPFNDFDEYMFAEITYLLNQANKREDLKEYVKKSKDFLKNLLSKKSYNPKMVFTSNDLMLKNFLVEKNKVVGLLDLEWAGSYPEYNDLMNIVGDFKFEKYKKEKEEFFKILKKNGLETEVSEPFKSIYELKGTLTGLLYYSDWFDDELEAEKYYKIKITDLKSLFN